MESRKNELEPIDPRTAQQPFLDHKETECTESTVRNHRYHTNEFVAWCEENDVDLAEEQLQLVHRSSDGTTLNNGSGGERPIAITADFADVLDAYIERIRKDVPDDHGRDPLFTTAHGRMSRPSIRRIVYKVTAPCFRNEPCPDCTESFSEQCPEAVSPHAVRRGSITHYLTQNIPVEVVSDRMNVSREVLDKHYDQRTEQVKLEQRRGYLENI